MSDFNANSAMGLFSTVADLYGGYKSYQGQKEAAELQNEASQQQVKTAGLQEAQAAQQEIAAVEQQRISEDNILKQAKNFALAEDQTRKDTAQQEGQLRAKAAASGAVSTSGSLGIGLNQASEEFAAERDWLAKANQSELDVMRKQKDYDKMSADMAADATRINAQGTRASAAQTKAGASQTEAGSYGSLLGSANRIWDIGNKTNWYGLG